MTVTTTSVQSLATGDGAQTNFVYNFRIQTAADLVIKLDGVVQGSGFTVNGAGDAAGGSVDFAVAPADGVLVSLSRDVRPLTQASDLVSFGANRLQAIEDVLDRQTMAFQEFESDTAFVGDPQWTAAQNATAFQAALDGGGGVIGPGVYDYDTTLVPPFGIAGQLRGSGRGVTILRYTGSDWAYKLAADTSMSSNVALRDLTIQGKGTTVTDHNGDDWDASTTASGGVLLRLCQNVILHNLEIIGFVGAGAWGLKVDGSNVGGVVGAWRNTISDVRTRGCRNGNWLTGLTADGQPNENTIVGCRVTALSDGAGPAYTGGICWLIDEGDNNRFISCEADGRDWINGGGVGKRNMGWKVANASASPTTTRYNSFIGIRAEECSIGFYATGNAARGTLVGRGYLNNTVDEIIDKPFGWTRIGNINSWSSQIGADEIMANRSALDIYLDADESGSNEAVQIWTGSPIHTMVLITAADGPGGPFEVGETIEDDSDSLIKGVITDTTGTAPNVTLRYTLNNQGKEFTASTGTFTGANSGATATAVAATGRVLLGTINAGLLMTGGLGLHGKNVPAQPAKIADPAGGATVDAESRTAIDAIIDVLEGAGLASDT